VRVEGSGYDEGDINFAFQYLDPVVMPPAGRDPANSDPALMVELVSLNDWYDPNWGGGYTATFDITLSADALIGTSEHDWTLRAVVSDAGDITNGSLDGYNADVTFNGDADSFSTIGQSYQLALVDGSTLRVSVQIEGSGYDAGDIDFVFHDLDPVETAVSPGVTVADNAYAADAAPASDMSTNDAIWGSLIDQTCSLFGVDAFDFW